MDYEISRMIRINTVLSICIYLDYEHNTDPLNYWLSMQDNFVHNRSLEAIRIYNPVEIPAEPNSGESVAATLAVDLIEREVYTKSECWKISKRESVCARA